LTTLPELGCLLFKAFWNLSNFIGARMSGGHVGQKRLPISSRNIWVPLFAATLLSLAMVETSNAEIGIYDHIRNICIEDSPNFESEMPLIEPQSQGPPISLGCKLRDCGPLANGRKEIAPINFRVRLDGDEATEAVLIEFSNLPAESFRDIKIKRGSGSIGVTQGTIRVPQGEEVVVEVPPGIVRDGRFASTAPKINATLLLNRGFLVQTRTTSQKSQSWRATLTIEQIKGRVVVNEFRALYILRWCIPPRPRKEPITPIIEPIPPDEKQVDEIVLTGVRGDLKRLALVNGKRESACIKDAPQWGTATISLENMLGTSSDCPSNEIVIFSPDRAMKIAKPDPDWTSKSDVVNVPLAESRAKVPVTFWILHKPEDQTIDQLKDAIKDELNRANELFGPDNLCGVEFIAGEQSYHDKIKEAKEADLSDVHCPEEGDFLKHQKLHDERKDWIDSSTVNVYYVSDFAKHRGSHCPGGEIFIGPDRDLETLAHELGHALGLNDADVELKEAHVETLDAARRLLTMDNLMISGGNNRAVLTQGQCYRCNLNQTSPVTTLASPQLKPTTRDCTGRRGPKEDCVDVFLYVKPEE
jgi:hypothetical protein